jgi:hypothetical protein
MRSPDTDVASSYADEGSMLHDMKAADIAGLPRPPIELSAEQVETLDKAGAMLKKLTKAWGGGFRVAAVEETIPFPGVPGSFGTVDLVLHSKTHVLIADWKFGSGVPVSALYELPDGYDMVNPQLAFYAICARAQRPKLFKGKKIVLVIIQPRLDSLSEVVTDHEELDDFKARLTAAYSEAIGRNPHRERGEHCRFARCKSTCKLWTGPLLTLEALDPNKAALRGSQSNAAEAGYATFLSTAMGVVELAETWAEEIRRQAHAYLSDGGTVAGWKLVPKRGTRQWKDPVVVTTDLMRIGALPEDIFTEPQLKSVAQVEKALKPRQIDLPEDLYQVVSSGTTIAHDDDKRPAATHATAIADLRTALKTL